MIPDEKTDNVGQQELIDLLYRKIQMNEEPTAAATAAATNNESEITIIDDNSAVEEGEISALDNDDERKKEVEDGELTESEESEVGN